MLGDKLNNPEPDPVTLLIFDWDGTLCDSTGKIVACMQNAAREIGLPVPGEQTVCNIIGLGLPEAVAHIYPEAPEAAQASLREAYRRHYSSDKGPLRLFDNVSEVLHKLRDSGYRLSIATGRSRRGMERVLDELGMRHFFHGSRCADETRSKPHPQMLQELLEEFNCTANEAVMVGDTEYDMTMAMEIGMPRVAVSYGAHTIERLKVYQPVLCMDDFSELARLFPQ